MDEVVLKPKSEEKYNKKIHWGLKNTFSDTLLVQHDDIYSIIIVDFWKLRERSYTMMIYLYKEILHNRQKGQDLHTHNNEREMDPKGSGWKLQSHFCKSHNTYMYLCLYLKQEAWKDIR